MKGLRFLLLGLAICLASGVRAQIYNSDVLFYVEETSSLTNPQTSLWIFRFKSGECYWVNKAVANELKGVCEYLKSNINYYETHSDLWSRYGNLGNYDSKMSNTKWIVYSCFFERLYDIIDQVEEWPAHTCYHAFSKDYSKYMRWSEPEYDSRGGEHRGSRTTWKRLTKTDLLKLSFTGARDFLQ